MTRRLASSGTQSAQTLRERTAAMDAVQGNAAILRLQRAETISASQLLDGAEGQHVIVRSHAIVDRITEIDVRRVALTSETAIAERTVCAKILTALVTGIVDDLTVTMPGSAITANDVLLRIDLGAFLSARRTIITGYRRLISFFFGPIIEAVSSGLGEM